MEHFFKNSTSQKAFEYHKDPSKVKFQDLSRDSIKAGLQRLTTDMKKPGPLYVHGPDYAKKKMWMEFKMMNLEATGFTLSGYKPTQQDLKELEQRKADYELQAQKWKDKNAVEEPKPVEPVIVPLVMPTSAQNVSEKTPEPIKQIEQEKVGPDDWIDYLMKELEPIKQDTATHEHQEELNAAVVKNAERDFDIFIDEMLSKHEDYKEIEILKYARDILEQNGNVIADAVLYFDITEKIDQLDDDEREICSAYVQKLIDDDGSGAPIDGELKQTTKRKFKLKM
ncbi:hypothetical protein ACTACD_03780 [Pseudomonas syringae]|uniref:hypothetical protein n=1 Tax=Pseudomonas syringae TaxID=317 RepID=UPI003F75EB64